MKKPSVDQEKVVGVYGHADEGFVKKFPQINTYMTDAKWDDGTPREPSTLTWSVTSAGWQVALNDKAVRRSYYCTAPTQAEAMKLLEKALADGVDAWRPWNVGKGKKGQGS